MAITILESGQISGVGEVSFSLQSDHPENSLIIAIITGGFGDYSSLAEPFSDYSQIGGSSYSYGTTCGIAIGRYASSMGRSITTYGAGTQGVTHWIGFYYVIAVGGTSATDAIDPSSATVFHSGSSPYFPFNYNSTMIPYSGSHGVYTYPSVTPSQNEALLIVPWQSQFINNPAPEVTGILDALDSGISGVWNLDCSTTYINPDEQVLAAGSPGNGNQSGTDGYQDCLYVGHALVDTSPVSYTPQIQFSGDGPLNNVIGTYYALGYSLQYAGVLIIKDPGGFGGGGGVPLPPGTIIVPPYMNLQSAGEYDDSAPNAPTIVSAEQASGIVVIGFLAAPISGVTPTSSFNLYRSISGAGSYSLVATNLISLTSVENLIFDRDASAAVRYDYYVCAVDDNGNISQPSNVVSFTPFSPASFSRISANRNISDAAFGPYPVLGSDFYLDPVKRDIVIGPNGDYLAVNGLELLAQDLRIRFLTEVGELTLHGTFGFDRSTFIGSGISNRQLQAQRLYQAFSSMLLDEPRVSSVLDVQISQSASDGWVITYIIIAIGSEDAAELNLVVPFLGGGNRNPATALPNSAVLVLPSSE